MEPNKHGPWWYYDKNGTAKLAELVGESPEAMCVVKYEPDKLTHIRYFEASKSFDRWIGPACPPIIEPKRYSLDRVYGSGGPTTEYEMVEDENGAWVKYEEL